MAASLEKSDAGPLESAMTPSMVAPPGVASKRTSKVPLWLANAVFCQVVVGVGEGVGVGAVLLTVTVRGLDVVVCPAVSVAVAVSVWEALEACVVFQDVE